MELKQIHLESLKLRVKAGRELQKVSNKYHELEKKAIARSDEIRETEAGKKAFQKMAEKYGF